MDSLLANYASSDEEEHEAQPAAAAAVRMPPPKPATLGAKEEKDDDFHPKSAPKRGGLFNSLPPPKSSLFNSLPPPKSESLPNPKPRAETKHQGDVGGRDEEIVENSKPKSSSSSLFSSLPQPKSASSAASKRVVQFKPPSVVNPHPRGVDDEDDSEDEGEKERQRKKLKESISTVSPASFLSSLPGPRHSATLGAMPSALGSGRRSIVETDSSASSITAVGTAGSGGDVNSDVGHSNDQPSEVNYDYSSWGSGSESHAYYPDAGMNSDVGHVGHQSHEIYDQSSNVGGENYAYYSGYGVGTGDVNSVGTTGDDAVVDYSYGSEHVEYANDGGSYVDYGNNAHHGYNYPNAAALPEVSREAGNALPLPGRRGRKDNPPEIVEVKQDELMKNRPREDQVKMTGIAFGPAYQPASTKGKPTKLHKRKHQIGSLYFDMKQKEMELAERRSRGFLTKAQTQAKYGW